MMNRGLGAVLGRAQPLLTLKNGFLHLLSDKAFYELMFRWNYGYTLPWDNVQTLNEKIQ